MKPAPTPLLGNGWRIAGWSLAAALLALPAIAMQFTGEVDWTTSDFVFAAILLGALGGALELALRRSRNWARFLGLALLALTAFLTVWVNLAVGILGNEDNPVNLAFFAMLAAGLFGSLAVRFRSRPLAWIAATLAAGQFAIGIYAALTSSTHYVEWGVLAFFAVLWSAAALCLSRSAAD